VLCCAVWHVQVVAPGSAPPGCSFCRPQFATAAAASSSHQGTAASAPLLQLEGLWHPLLGSSSSSGCVVPNDLVLGGDRPGAMLLTGGHRKHPLARSYRSARLSVAGGSAVLPAGIRETCLESHACGVLIC
jgi:hypothetical protein